MSAGALVRGAQTIVVTMRQGGEVRNDADSTEGRQQNAKKYRRMLWLALVVTSLLALVGIVLLMNSGPLTSLDQIPPLSRTWNGEDYQAVVARISNNSIPLPLFRNEEGAIILRKLTARENLSHFHNDSIPFNVRAQDIAATAMATESLTNRYYAAARSGRNVHKELTATKTFGLFLLAAELSAVDRVVGAGSTPGADARQLEKGMGMVDQGTGMVVSGIVDDLHNRALFRKADVSEILSALASNIDVIVRHVPPDRRSHLKDRLTSLVESGLEPGDLSNLQKITDAF